MENEISILEENSIRSKIHVIRGQQVMLDFDLAQIYGYETKNFNRQVKNNIERFDSDFMFQLSDTEVEELSRCKIFTLNKGRGSNIKYAPYAFTEQGIYMLMTVLKGDLAVTQSKMLIRTFKEMKHFIVTVKTPTPKKQNESNVKYMPWRKLWHEHFTQMKKKQSTLRCGKRAA